MATVEPDAEGGGYAAWRTYVWPRPGETVDVLAVRSARIHTQRHEDDRSDITLTVPDAGGIQLTLPGNYDYGFARLGRVNGTWVILEGYQIGLQGPSEEMTSVSIVGPRTVDHEADETWTARVNGGVPPFTYRWHAYYRRCIKSGGTIDPFTIDVPCGWQTVGTARQLQNHAFRYFQPSPQLRLRVWDANGSVETTTLSVDVNSPDGAFRSEEDGTAKTGGGALPVAYALHGAQPNPARGATVLRYDLPELARVTLTVYDVLGRTAAVLVDRDDNAGEHAARLFTVDLAPGVNVACIEAGREAGVRRVGAV